MVTYTENIFNSGAYNRGIRKKMFSINRQKRDKKRPVWILSRRQQDLCTTIDNKLAAAYTKYEHNISNIPNNYI